MKSLQAPFGHSKTGYIAALDTITPGQQPNHERQNPRSRASC